jgi:NADH:ubiquinone oxidoreductase subunit E
MNVEELDIDKQIGEVGKVLDLREKRKGILIHVLHQIQEDQGFLPGEELQKLSKNLNIPLSEIYSIASFYKMFHFKPRGRKIVKVCLGTACYVRGAKKVLAAFEDAFDVKNGETTEDLLMTLETVGCVGCCGLAPVATVNEDVVGEIIGDTKVETLIGSVREE